VDCLNLSQVQNERNRNKNKELGLDGIIRVIEGNFEEMPSEDQAYDVVWSQDSILHSSNRKRVLEEVNRVLKPGGLFIFTDIMQSENCPLEVIEVLVKRIHLSSLASFSFYQQAAQELLWEEVLVTDLSEHLPIHYAKVLAGLLEERERLLPICGTEYLYHMTEGLKRWISAGEKSYLTWGIMKFQKQNLLVC